MGIKKLVIASHNKGKIKEIGELIAPLGIEVVSAGEAGVDEPEETGLTFAENAALKARNAVAISGLASLADDSGLAIPALGGAPGIYSARWAGADKDFAGAFARIQKELPTANGAAAYFVCALCLSLPNGEEHIFEGRIDGTLLFPPRGTEGFGYDPIFIPEHETRTFGEMPAAEKHSMSHRARAFVQFVDYLKERT